MQVVIHRYIIICIACEFETAEDAGIIVPCNPGESETRDTAASFEKWIGFGSLCSPIGFFTQAINETNKDFLMFFYAVQYDAVLCNFLCSTI